MKKRISIILVVMAMLFSNGVIIQPSFASDVSSESVNEQIALLPNSMLASNDVEVTFQQLLRIKEDYNSLSNVEKEEVTNYSQVEALLDGNNATLDVTNVEKVNGSYLEGKKIGYLGSSITYGFQSGGVAFPEYIAKKTGSSSIKQAITGGPLALKEGVRDEISYITQLLEGALLPSDNIDALVVQLSTNDAALGIEVGELSASFNKDDFDYATIIGAMEYIIAYAQETWNCPVVFYTNPYLSDEAIQSYIDQNGGSFDEVKSAYQNTYQTMVDALYDVQTKWEIGIIDMWNNDSFKSIDVSLREYYMADPIHPTKAGYCFWYSPFMQKALEKELMVSDGVPSVDLVKDSLTTYSYNASDEGYTNDYSTTFAPIYYLYAGDVNEVEAEALLDEMKIADNLHEWVGSIKVVRPINGSEYTSKDADAFISLIGGAISNVKVIGIDEGATFVNNYISQKCYAVAGIMTYGGTMDIGLSYNVAVPTYLSNPCDEALKYYVGANGAKQISANEYVNETNSLQKVVVGSEDDLASVFANAWENVFSKNYRQHNEKTEFYMSSASVQTEPYLLINIPDYDELKIQYNPNYSQPVNGEGAYTWFEYIPEATFSMEKDSVPLIISLHGNGNDARLQGETTGWVELAAQENLMIVAPEWQNVVYDSGTHEPGPNFFNCDGLEGDKLIELLEVLKVKYPQIDTSRIYVTGLSAGGSASILYGAKYSNIFAGVGAVSAPGVDKKEVSELATNYSGNDMAMLYVCGDHDFFGMIPVDLSSENCFQVAPGIGLAQADENVDIFPYIQAYQKINGLPVAANYDMSLNPYYGIALDNEQWIKLGVKDTLEGTLSNDKGVIMKFAAIKDQAHWNYKPEAQYLWDFFKSYRRNPTTGELIIETSNPIVKPNRPTVSVATGDNQPILIFVISSLVAMSGVVYRGKRRKEF